MKKLKVSLLIIGGVVLFLSGGVIAATLTAKDIGFTSANEEWQVDNVEDAMNDLYDNIPTLKYKGKLNNGYWTKELITEGTIDVEENSYYILNIWDNHPQSVSTSDANINVSGCEIIQSTYNTNHTRIANYVGKYNIYYIYTTSDKLKITSDISSYLSYTTIKLFN